MKANSRIDSRRLILEPLAEHHASEAWQGLRDPRLYAFIPAEPPPSPSVVAERYRKLEERRSPDGQEIWLNWIARERARGLVVGTFQATIAPSAAYVAYMLFHESWGCGFGREGLAAVAGALFDRTSLDHLKAEVDERNERSVRLLRAVGFEVTARVENADQFKGATSNELHFSLSREAWEHTGRDCRQP